MIHEMLNLEDPVYNSIQQLSTEKSIQPKQQTKINPTTTNSGLSTRRWILFWTQNECIQWIQNPPRKSWSHLEIFFESRPRLLTTSCRCPLLTTFAWCWWCLWHCALSKLGREHSKIPGTFSESCEHVCWVVGYLGVPAKLHDVC